MEYALLAHPCRGSQRPLSPAANGKRRLPPGDLASRYRTRANVASTSKYDSSRRPVKTRSSIGGDGRPW
jgi:hypothetical protein